MYFLEKLLKCTPDFFKEHIEINDLTTYTCLDENENPMPTRDRTMFNYEETDSDRQYLFVNPFDDSFTEQGNNFEDMTFRVETIRHGESFMDSYYYWYSFCEM